MTLIPTLPMFAASIVAIIAMITDVRARRIPNWLTAASLVLGLVGNVVLGSLSSGGSGAVSGVLSSLMGAGLGFALLFPLYMIRVNGLGRAIGAGDVKLLAALGAILGPHVLISVAVYAALAGAVQSMVILAIQGRLMLLLHETLVLRTAPSLGGRKAPYAVPIAAGVLLSIVLSLL